MCLLVLHSVDDLLVLGNDEWVVQALVLKVGEDLECFILIFVGDEPSAEYVTRCGSMDEDGRTLETLATMALCNTR